MSHVFLILPQPDWIQLSNVSVKFTKHGVNAEAYTLTTCAGKLASKVVDKIHIIGHGNAQGPVHCSITQIADALKASRMPDGTKLRLDTCSSAGTIASWKSWFGAATPNFAQALIAKLKSIPYNYKTLTVEGTVGSSITGFITGREVVDPQQQQAAGAAQEVLMILFWNELGAAENLVQTRWNENLSSADIRTLATDVRRQTDDFFTYFRKYLNNLQGAKGTAVLMAKQGKGTPAAVYKKQYT